MKRYQGNQTVQPGFYASFGRKELLSFDQTDTLPGTEEDTFYSLPVFAVLLAGPFVGLLLVMFLPFISLAMVITLLSRKIAFRIAPNFFRKVTATNEVASTKSVMPVETLNQEEEGEKKYTHVA